MQRIEVRNFRQIEQADVQVNDLTLLIGEQASGKSTIAKLIYFFKSLRKDLVELSRSQEEITGRAVSNRIRDKFYLYFGSSKRLAKDYSIKFFFDEEKFMLIDGQPPIVWFEPKDWFEAITKEVRRAAILVNHYRQRDDLNAAQSEERILDLALAELLSDEQIPLYIPAGRNVTVSYTDEFLELFREMVKVKMVVSLRTDGTPKRQDAEEIDLILLRDFILHSSHLRSSYIGLGLEGMLRHIQQKSIREALATSISSLLKARYRNTEARGEYLLLPDKGSLELRRASSGQQEVIRIVQDAVLQISDANLVFRLIEEPEAHLFPSGQHRLMEILAALINTKLEPPAKGNNQVFITTHSPYLLSILNNLLFAGGLSASGEASNDKINEAGIPSIFRLKPRQVSAYMLEGGTCLPINDTARGDFSDTATGAIEGNVLENYWNELQNQFDDLIEISS